MKLGSTEKQNLANYVEHLCPNGKGTRQMSIRLKTQTGAVGGWRKSTVDAITDLYLTELAIATIEDPSDLTGADRNRLTARFVAFLRGECGEGKKAVLAFLREVESIVSSARTQESLDLHVDALPETILSLCDRLPLASRLRVIQGVAATLNREIDQEPKREVGKLCELKELIEFSMRYEGANSVEELFANFDIPAIPEALPQIVKCINAVLRGERPDDLERILRSVFINLRDPLTGEKFFSYEALRERVDLNAHHSDLIVS